MKTDPRAKSDTDRNENLETTTSRRKFVVGALGTVTAAALSAACGGDSNSSSNASGGAGGGGTSAGGGGTSAGGGGTSAGGNGGSGGGASCTLYPEETEGPFYLDGDLVRSDITEGKSGTPLAITLIVQRASDCTPLKNIAVDIWQCDAGGVYSGYPNQLGGLDTTGQKFLRGTQMTGDDGSVKFQTIYPGWYPGRTTHIHFKVHTTATAEATSQLYFAEETTAEVYTTSPYDARGQKDTTNVGDAVTAGNVPPLLQVTKTSSGYDGTLTVTIAG